MQTVQHSQTLAIQELHMKEHANTHREHSARWGFKCMLRTIAQRAPSYRLSQPLLPLLQGGETKMMRWAWPVEDYWQFRSFGTSAFVGSIGLSWVLGTDVPRDWSLLFWFNGESVGQQRRPPFGLAYWSPPELVWDAA